MNFPWLLAHFIGDFLLQSDWMAVQKKQKTLVCTIHVLFYMLPFLIVDTTEVQLILIAVQHWVQDRYGFIKWYCCKFGIFQGELKQPVLPWGHFIVDQIFHTIWLWFVFEFCG